MDYNVSTEIFMAMPVFPLDDATAFAIWTGHAVEPVRERSGPLFVPGPISRRREKIVGTRQRRVRSQTPSGPRRQMPKLWQFVAARRSLRAAW